MSSRRPSLHAISAIALVSLSALACASKGKSAPDPAAMPAELPAAPPEATPDPTQVQNTDGKSVDQLLATRFPGVTVTQVYGGGLQIRIRGGGNTFGGSQAPLYVVDDTPLPPDPRGIVFLNPYDIDKIVVLKNPADLAVYGVKGGGGVIKITTKKAVRR